MLTLFTFAASLQALAERPWACDFLPQFEGCSNLPLAAGEKGVDDKCHAHLGHFEPRPKASGTWRPRRWRLDVIEPYGSTPNEEMHKNRGIAVSNRMEENKGFSWRWLRNESESHLTVQWSGGLGVAIQICHHELDVQVPSSEVKLLLFQPFVQFEDWPGAISMASRTNSRAVGLTESTNGASVGCGN